MVSRLMRIVRRISGVFAMALMISSDDPQWAGSDGMSKAAYLVGTYPNPPRPAVRARLWHLFPVGGHRC